MNQLECFNKKRVLITGHTGFKGSWLCLLLNKLGAEVYGLALEPHTEPNLFSDARIGQSITSSIADIRNVADVKKIINEIEPEIVIHLAAQTIVRVSYEDPIDTFDINVVGTANIIKAAIDCSHTKVILNVTSDKCYENNEWYWGYRESDRLGGHDPYSASKACSEIITSSLRRAFAGTPVDRAHKKALATARAGNVIGGGDWARDRLLPDFFKSIIAGKTLSIRSPNSIRPWQHVLEPLRGYLLLCANLYNDPEKYSSSWNFGPNDDDAKPVSYIVDKLCTQWGQNASYQVIGGNHPHEATYLKLDCAKAKQSLGWHPVLNLDKAIDMTVSWYKRYSESADMNHFTNMQIDNYLRIL